MIDPDTLRGHLEQLAAAGQTATYQQVATALTIRPPQSIHRLTRALEGLMEADAAAGRPLLAAVVVSRRPPGMPAPGFFAKARLLGRYAGPERGPEARAWHRRELAALQAAASGRGPSTSGGRCADPAGDGNGGAG